MMKKILFIILLGGTINIAIAQIVNPDPDGGNTPSPTDTTGLNSLLNIQNSYFPMRAAVGVEIAHTFNFANRNRTEVGLNLIATSWHHLERNIAQRKENDKLGMFQIGTILSVNRTGFGQSNDFWQLNLGLLYNRIAVEQRSIGVTLRAKASTILGPEAGREFIDDFYLNAEAGLTFAGVVNLYYGLNLLSDPVIGLDFPTQYIGVSLSLNVSYFKFGLQGM